MTSQLAQGAENRQLGLDKADSTMVESSVAYVAGGVIGNVRVLASLCRPYGDTLNDQQDASA